MFSRILVAIDTPEESQAALDLVRQVATSDRPCPTCPTHPANPKPASEKVAFYRLDSVERHSH